MIIAIDGPAGSGKSSTARALADRLGGYYLDTGAMYRAVGLAFVRAGVVGSVETDAVIERILAGMELSLRRIGAGLHVFLGDDDVTSEIRTAEASEQASRVSTLPQVRLTLVELQRHFAGEFHEAGQFVVVEGRDIGTVVFPEADVKFFMVADPHVRAKRRQEDLRSEGVFEDLDQVLSDMEERDRRDEQRTHSPLVRADDAVVIDTTGLTREEQLDAMHEIIDREYQHGLKA